MAFSVSTRTQPGVGKLDPTICVLQDGGGGRAEVWPALGFNCFACQTVLGGRSLDILYADPNLFGDGRPTRSGIPILFPFPNRIRDAKFAFGGQEYSLKANNGPNAIHGFAYDAPWDLVDYGQDGTGAFAEVDYVFQANAAPSAIVVATVNSGRLWHGCTHVAVER